MVEPDEGAGEGDGGEVAVGAFVVAGGDAAPLFEAVEAAFDDVAAPVDSLVEPAGPFAAASAAGELVDAFGDGGLDPASAEVGPEGAG